MIYEVRTDMSMENLVPRGSEHKALGPSRSPRIGHIWLAKRKGREPLSPSQAFGEMPLFMVVAAIVDKMDAC